MRHIDYGLSVLKSSVIAAHQPGTQFDLADTLSQLAAQGTLAGYEAQQRFYEIGSFSGLMELDDFLTNKQLTQ